jgi:hypothetical protein
MPHPSTIRASMLGQEELSQFLQVVCVFFQLNRYIDVYVGKQCDDQYQ